MTEYVEPADNEGRCSLRHLRLQRWAARTLRRVGCSDVKIEGEVPGMRSIIDVVGKHSDGWVAVEVGNCSERKIERLRLRCLVVLHIPYCWTPEFLDLEGTRKKLERVLSWS